MLGSGSFRTSSLPTSSSEEAKLLFSSSSSEASPWLLESCSDPSSWSSSTCSCSCRERSRATSASCHASANCRTANKHLHKPLQRLEGRPQRKNSKKHDKKRDKEKILCLKTSSAVADDKGDSSSMHCVENILTCQIPDSRFLCHRSLKLNRQQHQQQKKKDRNPALQVQLGGR